MVTITTLCSHLICCPCASALLLSLHASLNLGSLIALIVAIPMGEVRDCMSDAVLWVERVGGKVYATRKFAAFYVLYTLCSIGAGA